MAGVDSESKQEILGKTFLWNHSILFMIVMSNYEKGRRFEYRVRDLFKKHEFLVVWTAQSKTYRFSVLENSGISIEESSISLILLV